MYGRVQVDCKTRWLKVRETLVVMQQFAAGIAVLMAFPRYFRAARAAMAAAPCLADALICLMSIDAGACQLSVTPAER